MVDIIIGILAGICTTLMLYAILVVKPREDDAHFLRELRYQKEKKKKEVEEAKEMLKKILQEALEKK